MAENVVTYIGIIFGSMGFWEFLRWVIASRRKKKSAEAEALLALLHDRLYPAIEKIHFRGVVGYDEMENIEKLYEPYVRLGGNGTIRRRFELINNYERVKDDELEAYDNGLVRRDR